MKRPELYTISFYDWHESWEYICEKYPDITYDFIVDLDAQLDVWQYLVERHGVNNGSLFTLDSFDLEYEGGRLITEEWAHVLKIILDEFGNGGTATFRSSW